ncbi:TonB-dependent receptor domain-containing protein [Pseudoteredinibacter isoporae]|uniref:TonB-dependent heme/hemoglobin receptor n=1 Tax=Pseudoteredinibacter isoporae TaxID=570281 RepID=A0A7X0JXN4_9GAMM|nr:TonB-dependent receptor [Pseudoteredinibacter isoporae]MBB6523583.1 TonB-dependent heme/hemoglobin receptor [Pseudoteredinibacter isoporae]NHO89091.1 TonB-dependent receptor [Pseudoteredinibacter isoporae]NIB22298.1 TonB-dependent receptor [Pseudoteredinibacter isoporae]
MRLNRGKSALALAIACASFAGQSLAEEKDENLELIEVIGHKLTLVNQDTPASISVITEKEIARQQQSELSQLLKNMPGVDLTGGVVPLASQPVVRGLYGERIHVSVDNVKRKIESDGGSNIATINSMGIDPQSLKRVQVLRGADSLTVGSGALGGSIRLATKDAGDYLDKNGFGGRVSLSRQDATDALVKGASAFYLDENLDVVLQLSQSDFEDIDIVGDRSAEGGVASLSSIKNESSRENVMFKTRWIIDDEQQLSVKVDWSETEASDQPYAMRQSYSVRYPHLFQDFSNDYLEGSIKYSYNPSSPLLDLDVQAVFSEKNYDEISRGFIPLRNGSQRIFDSFDKGETTRNSLRVSNLSTFEGLISHKLAIEFNYEQEDFVQNEVDNTNPNAATTFYGDSEAINLSASIIDQSSFLDETLLLTLGVRFDSYERNNNQFGEFGDNDDSEISSNIGLTYKAMDFLNLFASYGEAFRAPSVQELYKKREWRCHIGGKICYQEPQPDLMPETSENWEAGFGLHWSDLSYADNISAKFIFFNNDIVNFIDNVPFMYYFDDNGVKQPGSPGPRPSNGVPVATHRDYSAKNIGGLQSRGLEVELEYSWQDLDVYLGYSTMNMDATGVPNFFLGTVDTDKQPYQEAPADKLSLNINYQLFDTLNVGAQVLKYREQKRLTEAYLGYGYGVEGYSLVNLNASFEGQGALDGLTVVLGVDNLMDRRYLRAPASSSSDPAEVGRNVKMSVSYQF